MNTRRIMAAAALAMAAFSGCAGKSPWTSFAGKPDLPPPVSVTAHSGDDDFDKLAQLDAAHSAEKPPGGVVGGAIASAFQKTKEAFTIEPKVVKAPDKLSLSTPTGEAGPALFIASARMHESQGNVAKAEALYLKALEESPQDLDILVHYARMHDRAGNLERAAEIYRQAIQAHPQEAAAYNDLGLCLARQNRLAGAIGSLQHAAELQPASPLYRNNLATVLVDAGRAEEALAHLIAVHAPAAAHYNVGYLLYRAGRRDEAVGYLQQASSIDPQMAPAASLLALMSGRRETPAAADEPLGGEFASAALHRTPPVSEEAGAGREVRISLLGAHSAATGEWGAAPTPSQVLPSAAGGGILMPPARAPLSKGLEQGPDAPVPHLLPPTK
ncbi:MAG: tetratricopeptide repeat protein [Planctomycetes bacterium]|nr:tetratricopeptide repeat protein [Planctomycetota bacterium]